MRFRKKNQIQAKFVVRLQLVPHGMQSLQSNVAGYTRTDLIQNSSSVVKAGSTDAVFSCCYQKYFKRIVPTHREGPPLVVHWLLADKLNIPPFLNLVFLNGILLL